MSFEFKNQWNEETAAVEDRRARGFFDAAIAEVDQGHFVGAGLQGKGLLWGELERVRRHVAGMQADLETKASQAKDREAYARRTQKDQ